MVFNVGSRTSLKNYMIMMVAEKDFYMAKPCSQNQLEFEPDDSKLTATSPDLRAGHLTINPIVDMENAAYRNDCQVTVSSVSSSGRNSDVFLEEGYRYGWKCLTSKLLQKLNRPIWFLICLSFLAVCQGLVVTGVAFTIVTSIEKQFGYSSTQVGLFGTTYDIAYGICCIFVGYVGHSHKPRWLGWGALVMAIGCIVVSLPRFIIGTYAAGQKRDIDLCRTDNSTLYIPECNEQSNWYYMFLFISGNALIGFGATPLYTLGPAHLDDIAVRGQGSLFLGIMYASAALGPAVGFMIGKPILSTWVDITQPADSNLTPDHRNWVGAWWIGYLFGAALLILPTIPLLGFPRIFPNTLQVRTSKKDFEDTIEENEKLKHDAKSVWPAFKGLIKNGPFILICLASASESLTIGGFSTFLPKFVETQFHFSASNSAMYTGFIVVPGAAGGIFLGGYLAYRFKWNCSTTLKAASVMAFVAAVCVMSVLIGCDSRQVVGTDVQYKNSSLLGLDNTCRGSCDCSIKYYKPICTERDQLTYFSPCHAGCSTDKVGDTFFNCSCFPPGITEATDGRCTPDCSLFPVFAVAAFLLMFFTFMNNVPFINATLRVVPEGQGSFAMGFQQVFVRVLGFIPAPTLFGSLIDKSCKLWQTDECTGDSSSCLEYDNEDFRLYLFALGVVFKFLSFVFVFSAYKLYKLPNSNEEVISNGKLKANGNIATSVKLNELPSPDGKGRINLASDRSPVL